MPSVEEYSYEWLHGRIWSICEAYEEDQIGVHQALHEIEEAIGLRKGGGDGE